MQKKPLSLKDATIATLMYADVFDYPLTRDELVQWLLFYESRNFSVPAFFFEYKNYITLFSRKRIVAGRIQKQVWQEKKRHIAVYASRLLRLIPTIKLIGITGGLSMGNAAQEDDIDLFFIVDEGTVWISRFFTTLVMEVAGLRRHPGDGRVSDKVCMNMFMATDAMRLIKKERDCFSAHEVLQMQPIFDRENTHKQFLKANSWVKFFLPNAWKKRTQNSNFNDQQGIGFINMLMSSGIWVLRFLEKPARFFQMWYMKNHRTTEVITDGVLRFHPRDARVWVKEKMRIRLAQYNIPIDKVFYAG